MAGHSVQLWITTPSFAVNSSFQSFLFYIIDGCGIGHTLIICLFRVRQNSIKRLFLKPVFERSRFATAFMKYHKGEPACKIS